MSLQSLLSQVSKAVPRSVVVALIAVAICLLLFRPGRKPTQAPPPRPGAAAATPKKGPAVSISTVGAVLTFEAGNPRLVPGAAAALLRVAECADVHLVTTLPEDSDALEAATIDVLASGGIFAAGGCERYKALFCSTEDGRGPIVRQLAPALHVDCNAKVLEYLAPHLPRVACVQPEGAAASSVPSGNMVVARSLAAFAEAHLVDSLRRRDAPARQ